MRIWQTKFRTGTKILVGILIGLDHCRLNSLVIVEVGIMVTAGKLTHLPSDDFCHSVESSILCENAA